MSPTEFLEQATIIFEQRESHIARCFKAGNLAEADFYYNEAENQFEALSKQISSEQYEAILRFATLRVESPQVPEGIVAPLESMNNLARNLTDKASMTWLMIVKEDKDRIELVSIEEERKRLEKQQFVLSMSPERAARKERQKQVFRENWIRSGMDPADFDRRNLYMGLPQPRRHLDPQSVHRLDSADNQSAQNSYTETDSVASDGSKPIIKPGRPLDPHCDEAKIERLLVKCGFCEAPIASVAWTAFEENRVLGQLPEGWEVRKFFIVNYGKIKSRLFKKTVI